MELANGAFPDRIGWRSIQVIPGSGTDVTSSVPATDPTDGLRSYPQDLLSSPADQRQASFEVRPGSGGITAAPGLAGGEISEDRALDGFANSLAGGDSHGTVLDELPTCITVESAVCSNQRVNTSSFGGEWR